MFMPQLSVVVSIIKLKILFLTLGFILFFGMPMPVFSNTLTVTTTSDVQDINDGVCSLREAVLSVNAGTATDAHCGTVSSSDNMIQLSDTTYCLNSTLGIDKTVILSGINGGSTTLDGGNSSGTSCGTASNERILSINTSNITVELNDMIIKGGMTNRNGGGIYLNGLAVLNLNRSQVISNQVISADAGVSGGGIFATNCDALMLTNTKIVSNIVSTNTERALGGGLYAIFCNSINIENTTFDQNQSITSSTDVGAYGGGLHVSEVATTTITNSTFSNNQATHTGTATSSDSNAFGGGIYIYGQTTNIVNATISGNKTQAKDDSYGAGLFAKGSVTVNIAHSTIVYNEAKGSVDVFGGGISHFPSSDGSNEETIKIINTILSDNVVSGGSNSKGDNCYGNTYTLGTNLFSKTDGCILNTSLSGSTVTDYTNTEANLSSLSDNGGVVQTHAIGSSSYAKDRATCLDAEGTIITIDARGVARDANCDIGAYEYVEASNTSLDNEDGLNDENGLDDKDGLDDEDTAIIPDNPADKTAGNSVGGCTINR